MDTVYYSDNDLLIRSMRTDDARIIYEIYLSYGWRPSIETYENYYRDKKKIKGRYSLRSIKAKNLACVRW
jgi:hypothetical protein